MSHMNISPTKSTSVRRRLHSLREDNSHKEIFNMWNIPSQSSCDYPEYKHSLPLSWALSLPYLENAPKNEKKLASSSIIKAIQAQQEKQIPRNTLLWCQWIYNQTYWGIQISYDRHNLLAHHRQLWVFHQAACKMSKSTWQTTIGDSNIRPTTRTENNPRPLHLFFLYVYSII